MDQHPYRATIANVPKGVDRPLWSVMIPTYNCAGYLRETLASVLAQAPGPEVMQIEVIDDCSSQDDPKAIVEELGKGRVNFYQQPQNVGYIQNFNTCLQRSKGYIVHILHGDDCVRNGFYEKMQQAFEYPQVGAAFCRQLKMDEKGHWQAITELEEKESGILKNWLERIAEIQRISTPSIVVRREVYEALGGFDNRFTCWGEDWEMWVRIAASFSVWYEVEPLAIRRWHSSSLTGNTLRSGKNIQDVRKAIAIVKHYLPENKADKLSKTASKNYALYALTSARKFTQLGDSSAAINQIREALLCSSSLKVIFSSLKLLIYVLYVNIFSTLRSNKMSIS